MWHPLCPNGVTGWLQESAWGPGVGVIAGTPSGWAQKGLLSLSAIPPERHTRQNSQRKTPGRNLLPEDSGLCHACTDRMQFQTHLMGSRVLHPHNAPTTKIYEFWPKKGVHEARVTLKGLVEGSVGKGSQGADMKRLWGLQTSLLSPPPPGPPKWSTDPMTLAPPGGGMGSGEWGMGYPHSFITSSKGILNRSPSPWP